MLTFDEFKKLCRKYEILKKASEILRVEDKDIVRVVQRFKREIEEMEKNVNF